MPPAVLPSRLRVSFKPHSKLSDRVVKHTIPSQARHPTEIERLLDEKKSAFQTTCTGEMRKQRGRGGVTPPPKAVEAPGHIVDEM